jgi:hypothetical protein
VLRSAAAEHLVTSALARALDDAATRNGPVGPTSLHRGFVEDRDVLRRYLADSLEGALAGARNQLAPCTDELWVLVWDGYITIDDWRTDAFYAHLEVKGESHAHLFAMRYGLDADGSVAPLEARYDLGADGRYAESSRSHPLPPGEGATAPHGQVLPVTRWWLRQWRRRR